MKPWRKYITGHGSELKDALESFLDFLTCLETDNHTLRQYDDNSYWLTNESGDGVRVSMEELDVFFDTYFKGENQCCTDKNNEI